MALGAIAEITGAFIPHQLVQTTLETDTWKESAGL
jgi:hypothetical protein